MATKSKQFTISLTQGMSADLDTVKKEHYCKDTQNDMIRDLICRGLVASKRKNGAQGG